ncbi:MAG TPA: DUF1842 domain-containing protein [Duganella sp.]|jgi:hypothetical protein
MSQLFTAVYEVNSAVDGGPTLRLNLVVDGRNDSVVGHVQLDNFSGASRAISVRGHHVQLDGEQPMQAIVLAGAPPVFPCKDGDPSAFQLLMVLPTAWKDGQVCYKMSFGRTAPQVLEIHDGIARAVLPEAVS